jgi:hypothetical protein
MPFGNTKDIQSQIQCESAHGFLSTTRFGSPGWKTAHGRDSIALASLHKGHPLLHDFEIRKPDINVHGLVVPSDVHQARILEADNFVDP